MLMNVLVFIVTGNEDPEESEESHDVDEVEEIPTTTTTTTESPPRNNDVEPESLTESPEESPADTADLEVEATLWPYVAQDE